jgi:xanthine dehydrogenase YagS FAD-binding subunit
MHPFTYARARRPEEAIAAVAPDPGAAFLAGGTTLLDLMKLDVLTPTRLIDVNALPLAAIEPIAGGLRIGALARMSDVAAHPEVVRGFPVISEALLNSASPQLRNMASIGGNVLQRTRCSYFRDPAARCNKRQPGSGCDAIEGVNRMHAILGTSDACIATHASDLAVALVALDASLHVGGVGGERSIRLADFYALPGQTPHVENALRHGEIILAIDVPASPVAAKSHYLKVRDRASYEFALVSVAACLRVEDGRVADSRVALGGVGTRPWRSPEAEAALLGRAATPEVYARAAQAALADARVRPHNAFKKTLAERAIVRALSTLGGRA